jgi:hypothetical protein
MPQLRRLGQGRFGDVPSRVAQFGYGDALQTQRDGELTAMMRHRTHWRGRA